MSLTFSQALDIIKQGRRVTRRAWAVTPSPKRVVRLVSPPGWPGMLALETIYGGGTIVPVPWTPTNEDLLIADWSEATP